MAANGDIVTTSVNGASEEIRKKDSQNATKMAANGDTTSVNGANGVTTSVNGASEEIRKKDPQNSTKMAANGEQDIVTTAVNGALEEIHKRDPENYAKLEADPAKKQQLTEAARATATETVNLAKELSGRPTNIEERLAKHLSKERIEMIRGGLSIPTFRMDVVNHVNLSRNGKPVFGGTRELTGVADVEWASGMQYASIVVEAILLVLSAVGISTGADEEVIDETVEEVNQFIETNTKMQRAVDAFIKAWDEAGDSSWNKSVAIFNLVKDSYSAGILWNTIKLLCKNMAWYDWAETAAKVSAMLIAALATDGTALIGEIALIVLNAVDFAKKMVNIGSLKEIKKSL